MNQQLELMLMVLNIELLIDIEKFVLTIIQNVIQFLQMETINIQLIKKSKMKLIFVNGIAMADMKYLLFQKVNYSDYDDCSETEESFINPTIMENPNEEPMKIKHKNQQKNQIRTN